MLPRDVEEFLALDYLEDLDPTLVYLASPFAHESAEVREARLEAVRHVCGKMIDQGRIVLSPLVYAGELAERGFHAPQGWYAWDLQFLARSDELLVLQLPRLGAQPGRAGGDCRRPGPEPSDSAHVAGGGRPASRGQGGVVRRKVDAGPIVRRCDRCASNITSHLTLTRRTRTSWSLCWKAVQRIR